MTNKQPSHEMENSMIVSSTNPGEVLEFPMELRSSETTALSANALQYFQQGMAELQNGNAALAVSALSHTVAMAPAFADGRVFLGIAHSLSSEIYPAIDQMEKATELAPDSFIAQYALSQLYFKLRVVEKGYERAESALKCVTHIEQRKMLTQLLREERARERNGIARPSFSKPFSRSSLLIAGGGLCAAVLAILLHLH
jgi:tetratricopeptide (TPR) repeat protein